MRTLDPALGKVPYDRRWQALQETQAKLASKNAITGVNWTERGPDNVGGRTRALMFDPNDATNKKVWAGGVGGGLWYNNDITDANSSWQKVNDFWDNMAITCIAYDPSNTNIFYVGTGEGYFNGGAVRGGGIWRTMDGGTTWNQISATTPASGGTDNGYSYIQKIVVNSIGDVFIACRGTFTNRGGIFKYDKSTDTWSLVLSEYYGIDVSFGFNYLIFSTLP